MRPGDRGKATTEVLAVTYVPNIAMMGYVWFEDGGLLYELNPFSLNSLTEHLRLLAKLWHMKPDTREFFVRLKSGEGWRWVAETAQEAQPA